jgi:predicted ester cyclase
MATTSAEQHKETVRGFIETLNEARYEDLDDYMTQDVAFHPTSAANDMKFDGIEAQRDWFEMSREAFPDEHYEIEHLLADGAFVSVHCTISGTHEGTYMGLEPTGESFEESMFVVARMEGEKIAEAWALADIYGTAMQFGLVPSIQELFAGEQPQPGA